MAIVEQLNIFLENRPGQLREFCDALRDGGVNMRALLLPDGREAGVARLVVDDAEQAIQVLKRARILAVRSPALAVEVGNHPGALGELADRLASGGVEIQYAYGSGTGERAVLVLGVSDLDAADRLVGNGAGKRGVR